ncbi:MAG: hydroxyphenylacetyl-CoA thioesterase PaaI [Ramlibacter sp.]
MDLQELARRVGEAMWATDTASKVTMGMELVRCAPGSATLRMAVRELHLNGHRICHGGFIFTLADSTFAFACNSRNKVTVAAGCSIEFLKPAQLGDVLTCVGVEQTLQGRHGIYDMQVSNQRGEVVAMFRGKSATIQGTVIADPRASLPAEGAVFSSGLPSGKTPEQP